MQKETNQHTKPNLEATSNKTLLSQPHQQTKFDEETLEMTVNNIGSAGEWNHEGSTCLALKNRSSFYIQQDCSGTTVFENEEKVYYCEPEDALQFSHFIYIKHRDFYLQVYGDVIYRKDIDDQPPYPFMQFQFPRMDYRSSFRYSGFNKKLIISDSFGALTFIDLERKQIEFKTKNINELEMLGEGSVSFKLFGEKENRMISLTKRGEIVTQIINYPMKKLSFSYSKHYGDLVSQNVGFVAVCSRNELILVGAGERIVVFKLEGNQLIEQTRVMVDQSDDDGKDGSIDDMECFGYFGNHVLWVGIDHEYFGFVHLYDYDLRTKQLKELAEKKVESGELYPHNLVRLGDKFYYTGQDGCVMEVSITL